MLEKNYTNPEGIGRFSFSESGEYRAPYKGEGIGVFVTVMIALVFEAALVIFALTLMHDWLGEYEDENRAAMFVSMTTAIVIAVGTIIIFGAAGLIIANIFSGMNCKYSATEDKFVAIVGGDTHVINYTQVQSITFSPKYFLGRVKGYDVDIVVNNKPEHFGVSFRGQYQSEKSTPFYIIKERLEIIERRRGDEMALYAQQKTGADKPISRNEIDRARLKKQHESDIFPPSSNNRENTTADKPSAAMMDSIAPKSASRPKPAGAEAPKAESAAVAAMQMPELKAKASSSAARNSGATVANGAGGDTQPAENASGMSETATENIRPSSELIADNADNDEFVGEVKSLSENDDYEESADITNYADYADLADFADVESAVEAETVDDIEDSEDEITDDTARFIKSSVKPDDEAEEVKKTNDMSGG